MSTLTASLPPNALSALDSIGGQPAEVLETTILPASSTAAPAPVSTTARILEAYEVAQTYAMQIADPDYKENVIKKLERSNVRGSLVVGVSRPEHVTALLSSVRNWKEVVANLKDSEIRVFQGTLPDNYSAYTAYASVREIAHKFGSPGLGTIQAKVGYQNDDDYYFCTMLRFPTDVITVQLKTDEAGIEHLHQWFAGQEITSRMRVDDGDTIVRCGVIIPQVDEQRLKKDNRNGNRQNRGRRAD